MQVFVMGMMMHILTYYSYENCHHSDLHLRLTFIESNEEGEQNLIILGSTVISQ